MLLTDTKHRLDVALLDPDGGPAGDGEVEVKLYKVDWRWWWERGEENLAAWADANVHTPLASGVVKVANGAGRLGVRDQVPRLGPLPHHRRRPGGRPPHRQGRLRRLAGLGGARAEGGGRRGDRPRLRPRQARVRPGRDGDPRPPDAAEGARPREPGVGLAGPAHRVDRGEGAGDALHASRPPRRWRRTSTRT